MSSSQQRMHKAFISSSEEFLSSVPGPSSDSVPTTPTTGTTTTTTTGPSTSSMRRSSSRSSGPTSAKSSPEVNAIWSNFVLNAVKAAAPTLFPTAASTSTTSTPSDAPPVVIPSNFLPLTEPPSLTALATMAASSSSSFLLLSAAAVQPRDNDAALSELNQVVSRPSGRSSSRNYSDPFAAFITAAQERAASGIKLDAEPVPTMVTGPAGRSSDGVGDDSKGGDGGGAGEGGDGGSGEGDGASNSTSESRPRARRERLEADRSRNAARRRGDTALHIACLVGDERLAIIATLTKPPHGSGTVNTPAGSDGASPLMRACEAGGLLASQLLVKRGADVNALDMAGRSALHYAMQHSHHDVAQYLLSVGGRRCPGKCSKCAIWLKLLARKKQAQK